MANSKLVKGVSGHTRVREHDLAAVVDRAVLIGAGVIVPKHMFYIEYLV